MPNIEQLKPTISSIILACKEVAMGSRRTNRSDPCMLRYFIVSEVSLLAICCEAFYAVAFATK